MHVCMYVCMHVCTHELAQFANAKAPAATRARRGHRAWAVGPHAQTSKVSKTDSIPGFPKPLNIRNHLYKRKTTNTYKKTQRASQVAVGVDGEGTASGSRLKRDPGPPQESSNPQLEET